MLEPLCLIDCLAIRSLRMKCGYDRRWSRTSLRLSLSPTLLHHASHERRLRAHTTTARQPTTPPTNPNDPDDTEELALQIRLQVSFYTWTAKRRRDIAVGPSHHQRLGRGDFAPWWGTPDKNHWKSATLEHVIVEWKDYGLSIHFAWTVGDLSCGRKSKVTAKSWPVRSGRTSKQELHR